jgi:FAD/FMN-containing dehydrogenase
MMQPIPLPPALRDAIAQSFAPDILSVDPDDLALYGRDWTRVHSPNPAAIALPRTTGEVAELLRLAALHRVAVVPSGVVPG